MIVRVLGILTVVALAAACVGEGSTSREQKDPESANSDPLDDGDLADTSSCSAAGQAADCDPVGLSGCGEGSCYLVREQGPSCVCSAGEIAPGEACNTSIECGPGSVCAGTVAPGVCRETCTADEDCPLGLGCRGIDGLEPWGYCEPSQAGGQ